MSVHPISVSFSLRDDIWPNYLKKGKQSESMETMEKSLASNDYFHYFIFEIQAGMNAPISHYHWHGLNILIIPLLLTNRTKRIQTFYK